MGGCIITFLTSNFTYVREHVAVVKCCQHVAHAVVYSSGGWGGYINVPDKYFTYVREHVAVVNMLHMLSYIYILYIYIFIHIIIYIIRGVRGCISVVGVCGHCVAKSTRALKLREEEKMDGWMFAWDD